METSEKAGRSTRHFRNFAAIGVALSAEKDIDKIFEMIIDEAMDFTHADG